MLEMELKVRLTDKAEIIKQLEQKVCQWTEPSHQEDIIYIKRDIEKALGLPVFRIRKTENKTILTLKIQERDLNTAKELELEISDDRIMHQMLQELGFDAKVEVKKKRRDTVYRGYTISIDEVERLGDFLEIEKIAADDAEREKEYDKMMKILIELGLRAEDIVTEKYFQMIQELKG